MHASKVIWAVLGLGLGGLTPGLLGHDLFQSYVQHRVQLSLKGDALDVAIELTFFEQWSERERTRMDTNADGQISRSEVSRYAGQLGRELSGSVALSVGRDPLELVVLHEPELDLLGYDGIRGGHHRLRLGWFARWPARLDTGVELVLTDRLWPQAAAILSAQGAVGREHRFQVVPGQNVMAGPAVEGKARLMRWQFCGKTEDGLDQSKRIPDDGKHESTDTE